MVTLSLLVLLRACSAAVQTRASVCIRLMKAVPMCTRIQGHLHPLGGGTLGVYYRGIVVYACMHVYISDCTVLMLVVPLFFFILPAVCANSCEQFQNIFLRVCEADKM